MLKYDDADAVFGAMQARLLKDLKNKDLSTIALISHASKVMLKILQARLQQYVNRELPEAQAGFRKGRGTRDRAIITKDLEKKSFE